MESLRKIDIDSLPEELLLAILDPLDFQDLSSVRLVSARLNRIIDDRRFKTNEITDENIDFVKPFLDRQAKNFFVTSDIESKMLNKLVRGMDKLCRLHLENVTLSLNANNLPRTLEMISYKDCEFDGQSSLLNEFIINAFGTTRTSGNIRRRSRRLPHFKMLKFHYRGMGTILTAIHQVSKAPEAPAGGRRLLEMMASVDILLRQTELMMGLHRINMEMLMCGALCGDIVSSVELYAYHRKVKVLLRLDKGFKRGLCPKHVALWFHN